MERNAANAHRDPLQTPGVYFYEPTPTRAVGIRTGQPVFFGLTSAPMTPKKSGAEAEKSDAEAEKSGADADVGAAWLTAWEQFPGAVGECPKDGFLACAVRGFFENGGERCLVVASPAPPAGGLQDVQWSRLLDRWIERFDLVESADEAIDLVCVPDLPHDEGIRLSLQIQLLQHCDRVGNLFAILDAAPGKNREAAARQWHTLVSPNGAIYYPWLRPADPGPEWAPPCGHVAGVYARTDRRFGPHKAPANEVIVGAVDVQDPVTHDEQGHLNTLGVNCIRVLPGRGIRVWGARTVSGRANWRYINVRRLFITVRRLLENECRDLVFEENHPELWQRIRHRLNNGCYWAYRVGALKGSTPEEAYYVKCDEETNPLDRREAGEVTTEIGLAATTPAEFIVVRITRHAGGEMTEHLHA